MNEIQNNFRSYKCKKCNQMFLEQDDLFQHVLTHAEIKLHTCEYCQQSFAYNCHLVKHMRSHVPKAYRCILCKRTYTRVENMINLHICKMCKHMYCGDQLKPEQLEPVQLFKQELTREEHKEQIFKQEPIWDEQEEHIIKQEPIWDQHEEMPHKEENANCFRCLYCDISYNSKADLIKHMQKYFQPINC